MNSSDFIQKITGQPVLFITTKNLDYIRNSQEIALLKKHAASVHIIGSMDKSYPKRLLSVWMRLLFQSTKPFSVVFVGFAPQLILPFFHWKFRKKYVIQDFFISLYDTMVCDRSKFSSNSLIGKMLHSLDTLTLRRSDLVICDTIAHGAFFSEEFSAAPDKIMPLYLEADTSIYYPRPKSQSERLRILYFGSILPLQGLPVILEAIESLKNDSRLEFVIVGPIPETVNKPTSENIHYIQWLSQDKLAEEIANADLCLAGHFHPTIQKAWRTIPGKAYIYEAMQKPMVLGDNPATRELETKWKVPALYVPMGNAKALADAIYSFFSLS